MNKQEKALAILVGIIIICILLSLIPSLSFWGGGCIFFGCPIVGLVGLANLFGDEEDKKLGQKLIVISLIGFLVGMSVCTQMFRP